MPIVTGADGGGPGQDGNSATASGNTADPQWAAGGKGADSNSAGTNGGGGPFTRRLIHHRH